MARVSTPEPVTKFCERCDTPEARGKWLGIARLTRIPDVGWPQRSECQKVVTAEEKAKGERIVAEYRAMEKQAEDNDVSVAPVWLMVYLDGDRQAGKAEWALVMKIAIQRRIVKLDETCSEQRALE